MRAGVMTNLQLVDEESRKPYPEPPKSGAIRPVGSGGLPNLR